MSKFNIHIFEKILYIHWESKLYISPLYISSPKQIKCTNKVNQSLRTKNRVIETVHKS